MAEAMAANKKYCLIVKIEETLDIDLNRIAGCVEYAMRADINNEHDPDARKERLAQILKLLGYNVWEYDEKEGKWS